METKENDKLLKNFFSEQKQEIDDNGFTKRVMRKLPESPNRDWIVWAFACIGILFSLVLGFNSGAIQNGLMFFEHIPIYYLLASIFCFPLVGSIGYYFVQDQSY